MFKRAWISSLVFLLAATVCVAQQADPVGASNRPAPGGETPRATGPLNNDVAGNARTLIPDGTSYSDFQGATAGKWFVANVEHGKSYVLEMHDPYGDLGNNCTSVTVYDSDGVTTPPASTELDYNASTIAPSMEVSVDGTRVAIRPDLSAGTFRTYYFKVTQCATGDTFKIRLREATIYSRWTVNSYNMFVALQNTTATDVQVQVLYYDDTGSLVTFDSGIVVPAFGATQLQHPLNTLNPNHGALRVQWWGVGAGLVPGAINVQTYAFNVAAGVYLDFVAERVNDGRTGRSW